jgi:hypothetical protein
MVLTSVSEAGRGAFPAESSDLPRVTVCCRRTGDVNVAIWARRRTVSSGTRSPISSPDAINVKRLQLDGFSTGSRERYDFRNSGVPWTSRVGSVDVRRVMGRRCGGIR